MKKIFFILIVVTLSLSAKTEKISVMVPFPDKTNLYIDDKEISNAHWKEYVDYNKNIYGEKSENYLKTLPDSSVWQGVYKGLRMNYFHPLAYENYPIAGVSYEQALSFCEWRSKKVNVFNYLYTSNKKLLQMQKNIDSLNELAPQVLKFRLPTIEEMKIIAAIDVSEKAKKNKSCTDNFLISAEKLGCTVQTTREVESSCENKIGVHNIYGNVAEMCSEQGYCFGGSWQQTRGETMNNPILTYSKSTNWLGFRCVREDMNPNINIRR